MTPLCPVRCGQLMPWCLTTALTGVLGAKEPISPQLAVGLEIGEVRELLNVGVWVKRLCSCPGVFCVQEKSV